MVELEYGYDKSPWCGWRKIPNLPVVMKTWVWEHNEVWNLIWKLLCLSQHCMHTCWFLCLHSHSCTHVHAAWTCSPTEQYGRWMSPCRHTLLSCPWGHYAVYCNALFTVDKFSILAGFNRDQVTVLYMWMESCSHYIPTARGCLTLSLCWNLIVIFFSWMHQWSLFDPTNLTLFWEERVMYLAS